MSKNDIPRDEEGKMIRNCLTNYVGCIGDLSKYVKNYGEPKEMKKKQCRHVCKKTGKQCITMLNQSTIKKGGKYCLAHSTYMYTNIYPDTSYEW